MNAAFVEHLYDQLLAVLQEVIQHSGDTVRLSKLLRGSELPAIGGQIEPAEQLLLAIDRSPDRRDLVASLSVLCAQLVKQAAVRSKGTQDVGETDYLYNLFFLSAHFPRCPELFDTLDSYSNNLQKYSFQVDNFHQVASQLRCALCNQQTDARLRDFWIDRLSDKSADWNSSFQAELLDAWRGVLWLLKLNPSKGIDWDLFNEALSALYETVAGRLEGSDLIRLALCQLDQTYPSSVGSAALIKQLRTFWNNWPQQVMDIAIEVWPSIGNETYQLIGIQFLTALEQYSLSNCYPVVQDSQGQRFVATCFDWDPDFSGMLSWVDPDQDDLPDLLINPPIPILRHQSVVLISFDFLEIIHRLNAKLTQKLFTDFVDIQRDFQYKVVYPSEYEQLVRDTIDLALLAFDKKKHTDTVIDSLKSLFQHINTKEERRLKLIELVQDYLVQPVKTNTNTSDIFASSYLYIPAQEENPSFKEARESLSKAA